MYRHVALQATLAEALPATDGGDQAHGGGVIGSLLRQGTELPHHGGLKLWFPVCPKVVFHYHFGRGKGSPCQGLTVLPTVIRTDGGPQFWCQEFLNMCMRTEIMHEALSPFNPCSNGLAESAVKNCKKLLIKCINWGGGSLTPSSWSFGTIPGQTASPRHSSCSVAG